MNLICSWLMTMTIVGAVEVSPDWMRLDYIDPVDNKVYIFDIYTPDYRKCFPNK